MGEWLSKAELLWLPEMLSVAWEEMSKALMMVAVSSSMGFGGWMDGGMVL